MNIGLPVKKNEAFKNVIHYAFLPSLYKIKIPLLKTMIWSTYEVYFSNLVRILDTLILIIIKVMVLFFPFDY